MVASVILLYGPAASGKSWIASSLPCDKVVHDDPGRRCESRFCTWRLLDCGWTKDRLHASPCVHRASATLGFEPSLALSWVFHACMDALHDNVSTGITTRNENEELFESMPEFFRPVMSVVFFHTQRFNDANDWIAQQATVHSLMG